MPATHKTVNGVNVPLTPAEAAAIEAEWADNTPGTGPKWLADQATALANLKAQAKVVVAELNADQQALSRTTRALALTTLAEVNALRQWLVSFKAAVAGAATLAALNTAVAALPNTPDRTAVWLRQTIRDQIDAE